MFFPQPDYSERQPDLQSNSLIGFYIAATLATDQDVEDSFKRKI